MPLIPAPLLPDAADPRVRWGQLYGSAASLALAAAVARAASPLLIVVADVRRAEQLAAELAWLLEGVRVDGAALPVRAFPDREVLAYDAFSPHQDIVSERLATLAALPSLARGAVVVAAPTLLPRLPPRSHIEGHAFDLQVGARLDLAAFRARLERAGYRAVGQVMEHGEYAVRGAVLDLFPMGSATPLRLDLFDDELESIRSFDPETQLTAGRLERITLLPARECPLDEPAVREFRTRWRQRFEGDPTRAAVYREVSEGNAPGGLEAWLPLFFAQTSTLLDHLPQATTVALLPGALDALDEAWAEVVARHQQLAHDRERPLLEPHEVCAEPDALATALAARPTVVLESFALRDEAGLALPVDDPTPLQNWGSAQPPPLLLDARRPDSAAALTGFLAGFEGRVLLAAESAGRRETLLELLRNRGAEVEVLSGWPAFAAGAARIGLAVAPFAEGAHFPAAGDHNGFSLIAEAQLFGERVKQRVRRRVRDPEAVLRDLTDLAVGAPVVHVDHGVGRYRGLTVFEHDGAPAEYLTLEYAGGDKLFVPVASLHLVQRYTGASDRSAPLHKLGGEEWPKARRRAAEQARDSAAELLEVYARRAARATAPLAAPDRDLAAFAAGFPFDETLDQQRTIDAVLADLAQPKPMDRLVCGDVGFGKTEVAVRAAFAAVQAGKQVAVLVPTTLLAQQHAQTFKDRFADWPVRVGVLSRFNTAKATTAVLAELAEGRLDVVVGTHALLGERVRFKDLGLVIIDEEHRFGVRHKEKLKALRAEVHVLTLTATPIPRTLSMSLAGIRDLSLIATPPADRLSVKTFVAEWNDALLREACLREIRRGGQVYFIHNHVETIERTAEAIRRLVPEASVRVAHGQMREAELEQLMLDFHHRRFNLLCCTTIVESGIDVPTANTMVIDRADRLGLAQLHQLRGRVGRSHHRAYCYLVTPPRKSLTPDAVQRLEAIESLEELGAGFTLATHDMEIRGAGELLGEGQSGQMHEVGFAMYAELLERAVTALKAGEIPDLERDPQRGTEVELGVPALLPQDYLPDVHLRLVLYKRIASAPDHAALEELKVEIVDRLGPLPPAAHALFRVAKLRIAASPLGVRRLEVGPRGGVLRFGPDATVDPTKVAKLVQSDARVWRFEGREKLRFTLELRDAEKRFATVEGILVALGGTLIDPAPRA
jgi:transcription-repair coupling factor (superfamily II helicase)